MKYTFETDELEEAQIIMAASDIKTAMWRFDQWLRDQIKHCDREDLAEVRTKYWETLGEEGVTPN
jgi:hypothetical protein